MKKIIYILVIVFSISTITAQTQKESSTKSEFNRFSIEVSGGLNKPEKPITSGYSSSFVNSNTIDLGVRYMFNNKFGLKLDLGYNSMHADKYDSRYYRIDGQGVANIGRILNFESWSKRFGLLGHAGLGFSKLKKDDTSLNDRMLNFMAGVTGQIKLTNRIALTADFTSIFNVKQNDSFDGMSRTGTSGFNGVLFNTTVGLTFYLGKKQKHIDWDVNDTQQKLLSERITALENKIKDTDEDGVADYLDAEPDTDQGTNVDVKGKAIDLNENNIPDDIERYILKNYSSKVYETPVSNDNEFAKSLINSGSVAVFFDFDQFVALDSSISDINFILTYLRNNPKDSLDIIGHTDGLGRPEYNKKLSSARAYHIKGILVKANISASRINIIAAGEDTSLDSNFASNRKLARRVSFQVR